MISANSFNFDRDKKLILVIFSVYIYFLVYIPSFAICYCINCVMDLEFLANQVLAFTHNG